MRELLLVIAFFAVGLLTVIGAIVLLDNKEAGAMLGVSFQALLVFSILYLIEDLL